MYDLSNPLSPIRDFLKKKFFFDAFFNLCHVMRANICYDKGGPALLVCSQFSVNRVGAKKFLDTKTVEILWN